MAKRAKPRPKQQDKFFLLYSDCGRDNQMEVYSEATYSSIEAAKRDIDSNDIGTTAKLYIVKVVATGNQKTIAWS